MSKTEKSKRGLIPLAELLPEALQHLGLEDKINETRVRQAWERVAPGDLRSNLRFYHFQAGTLYFQPAASLWAQALRLAKGELIPLLNETLGEQLVRDLRAGGVRGRPRRSSAPY
jgi:predicted nucleic acid-binding Zn ribbon protein